VSVDHIGSTAVPGLDAKPIIDIDITLSSLDDVPDASAELIKLGFEPRGNRYDDDVWALDYPNLGCEFDVGGWYRIQPTSFAANCVSAKTGGRLSALSGPPLALPVCWSLTFRTEPRVSV